MGVKANSIYVISSSAAIRSRIRSAVINQADRVVLAAHLVEALTFSRRTEPSLVLFHADADSLRMVDQVVARMAAPVVVLSSDDSASMAVEAMRAGAIDCLGVLSDPDRIEAAAATAMAAKRDRFLLDQAKLSARDNYGFNQLLTQSPRMLEVFDQIRQVARTDATVLVLGETGTGKELVSRAVHDRSKRKDGAFVAVNCGAFTETILESELFGHEKGSFTGAVGRQEGLFEMADGGSLFLDELGETSASVQVNLLRVLETMSFRRVGGRDDVHVDVRIIAATHVLLEQAVEKGDFRRDLFYRLNVFPIVLPPLRKRPEDIPLLMRHFLDDIGQNYDLDPPSLSAGTLDAIMNYPWPGNVRQLRAMCERWVITHRDKRLLPEDLPPDFRSKESLTSDESFDLNTSLTLKANADRAMAKLELEYLQHVLRRFEGHLGKTAEAAGITRRTLYSKMKQHRLQADSFRH